MDPLCAPRGATARPTAARRAQGPRQAHGGTEGREGRLPPLTPASGHHSASGTPGHRTTCKISHKMRPVAHNLRPSSHRRCADPSLPPPLPLAGDAPHGRETTPVPCTHANGNPSCAGSAHLLRDNAWISASSVRLAAQVMCDTVPIHVWGRRTLCAFLHPRLTTRSARIGAPNLTFLQDRHT